MTIFCYAVVLVAILWTALSLLPAGAESHMPLPYMIALTPFLWIPLIAISAYGVATHDWALTVISCATAISASSRRLSYWGKAWTTTNVAAVSVRRETSRETTTFPLRAMTLNCRYGRANAEDIVRQVRERGIDVLALQELSNDLVRRLDDAGLRDSLPYRQCGEAKDSDNGGFNAVFSRIRPVAMSPRAVEIPAADVPFIMLPLEDGRTLMVVSAHPKSPMRGCAAWSKGIRGLGAMANGSFTGDRGIVAVMGDLNSSIEHPSFRALLRNGFQDASLIQGKGPNLTFPRWIKWPRIELDHVLFTSGLVPSGVESFEIRDTDHLALTATLTLV